MEKHEGNNIRKYFVLCSIAGIVLLSLWIAIYFAIPRDISVIFSLFIILFLMKLIIRIIANKTIASVLFNDLNAQQFHQIITTNKHFLPPLSYRINAKFFTGDYQTVVNIISCQIRKKRCSIKEKLLYLSLLARVYFELRDFEKLRLLLNEYDRIKGLYPSKKLINTANSIWSYYRYFLDGNFEACKTICREKLLELNSKAWDAKIRKLNNDFAYAVACYENGEKEIAQVTFSNIINYAPNMHPANVSKKYLEAIEANSQLEIFEKIAPQEECQVFDNNQPKKARRNRIIIIVLCIIFVVLNILISRVDTKNKEYEKDLNNAISQHYDQAEFIKYFNVKVDEKYIDALCVVDEKNSWDLVSIITYDGGETSDIIILMEGININQSYCIKSAVSDYYIGFQIHTCYPKDNSLYYIVDFTYNNKNYWFAIDYIGNSPAN